VKRNEFSISAIRTVFTFVSYCLYNFTFISFALQISYRYRVIPLRQPIRVPLCSVHICRIELTISDRKYNLLASYRHIFFGTLSSVSYISNSFHARGLLIALMMEAAGALADWFLYLKPFAHAGLTHRPDDGGSKDLWNVGKLLPDYTALQPRR
jgi:hypothetical protein